ncbi:MAG: hypothetical protein R3C05_10975 [Pirellulaceae bacterium]
MSEMNPQVQSQLNELADIGCQTLTAILSRLKSKFDDLVRWETNLPKDKVSAKPANISATTDS